MNRPDQTSQKRKVTKVTSNMALIKMMITFFFRKLTKGRLAIGNLLLADNQ